MSISTELAIPKVRPLYGGDFADSLFRFGSAERQITAIIDQHNHASNIVIIKPKSAGLNEFSGHLIIKDID